MVAFVSHTLSLGRGWGFISVSLPQHTQTHKAGRTVLTARILLAWVEETGCRCCLPMVGEWGGLVMAVLELLPQRGQRPLQTMSSDAALVDPVPAQLHTVLPIPV